ncbi:MAG TPA: DUF302 domain-containing protein [Rhizomicrobium sp.]|jgi:uncharacterized protein (DUF302 family)|nr:DUF302 domain-containing protein [Rhizomicrobium sp.]
MTAQANPDGLVLQASHHDPAKTMERLIAAVTARGMSVFARIDHAAAAASAGLTLRPTEVLIFGNAKAGTPLMQSAQTTGIDLPLKALVFENGEGKTCIAYNNPKWIAARHGAVAVDGVLETMTATLAAVVQEAI